MARKIVIFSTKTNSSQSIMSDATTWGSLRSEIPSLINEDMIATVLETKNQLVSLEALLPEGEFKLVLTPAKTKSGNLDTASIIASLKQKFDDAFEEVLNEIEDGEHGSSSISSEDAELRREADKIRRELGV